MRVAPLLRALKLEGKLASLWVYEAAKCAQEIVATVRSQSVAVDLSGVTVIDEPGKKGELKAAYTRG